MHVLLRWPGADRKTLGINHRWVVAAAGGRRIVPTAPALQAERIWGEQRGAGDGCCPQSDCSGLGGMDLAEKGEGNRMWLV